MDGGGPSYASPVPNSLWVPKDVLAEYVEMVKEA